MNTVPSRHVGGLRTPPASAMDCGLCYRPSCRQLATTGGAAAGVRGPHCAAGCDSPMPRKKAPGTAADPRNGAKSELRLIPGQKPELPVDWQLSEEALIQWNAYWDDTVSGMQSRVDRGVLFRWIRAVNRYFKALDMAEAQPLVSGSTGQQVMHPMFRVAEAARLTIVECEAQLGIGAKNRASLGIAALEQERSMRALNEAWRQDFSGAGDTEDSAQTSDPEDPRVIDG